LYVLTGLLILGALTAATLVRPAPAPTIRAQDAEGEAVSLEEAA
jgi:hypothetical protein